VKQRHQVVIVGGGPVGVALAVDLGLRGISCALVETRPGLTKIPKGQNLTQRTLEHFYFWGILDDVRAARLMPNGYAIGELTAYDNLMSGYTQVVKGREVVRPYYFQANDRMPQYQMETVLRAKMAGLPNIESLFGWSAKTVEQDDTGARVTVVEENGPGRMMLEADYVVGCDGGHSVVREQVGIARGGTDFDQMMALIVFRSRELHEGLRTFPERSVYRVMHPDFKGYWQFFGRIDVGENWFFHAPVPAGVTKDTLDAKAMIHKAAGFEFACEFEHIGLWDLRVAVADKYQVGRVLIAGDAAHSHPPYGAFGLNNGLEDATNLGWKLAAKLQGWGSDALVTSYSEERRPIFYETAEDFIAARIKKDAVFLEKHNPNRDRDDFEQAWNARVNENDQRARSYEPNYEGSSVIHGPPGGVCSAAGTHTFTARAGHHLPPQDLSSGNNIFEELGDGFALLAFDADDATVTGFEQAAKSLNLPFRVVRDSYADGRTAYEARLILVRPDQYVVWTGDTPPADARALMAKAVGRV
jgi:2-polyprenyl-6-methoxyphenol hydroxylase-like FAD-dependent oxidoreductase